MTILALIRESKLGMGRFDRSGKILLMTTVAVGRSIGEFLPGVAEMARFTIGDGVCTHQCKALCGVQFESILMTSPVLRSMTLQAILAKLSPMLIGMTVDTTGADMTEDRIFVAADTGGGIVRSNQLKAGGGMVELQRITHSTPRISGMTILAIPFQ